jgi:hypothetical protein
MPRTDIRRPINACREHVRLDVLRNRETKRAASARYSSRAPIRVSHLALASAQYRAVRKMRAITIIRT